MIVRRSFFLIPVVLILVISIGIITYRSRKSTYRPIKVIEEGIPKEKTFLEAESKTVVEKNIPIKIAIVIDDLGYNLKHIESILNINKPITLSILPNISYSGYIAKKAAENGYEVVLHLPLEPFDENAPLEKNTITTSMKEDEILERLKSAVTSVEPLKGVSNHMGSKATQDKNLMYIIFKELKKKKLYFLDTLVTDKSVCQEIAKKIGLEFITRDIYLDNLDEEVYIKNQFKLLIKEAKQNGYAIGIGHDRALTIKVLAEEMANGDKYGAEFVFVSELIK